MWSVSTFSGKSWKYIDRRWWIGETPISPIAEIRSCRSQAFCSGVWPEGAHVRRRTGCSMKPLSSKNTIGTRRRVAPFLFAAIPAFATGQWTLRLVRVLAVRASGTSCRGSGESSTRELGDTSHRNAWQLPRPPVGRSKGRCGNRTCRVRPRGFSQVVASVSRSGGAGDRDVVWPSRHLILLSARPDAIALLKTRTHRRFEQPRRQFCLPAVTSLQAAGETLIGLCFLSFSYSTVRMFTADCSLAMQGSIVQQGPPGRALSPISAGPTRGEHR